MKFLFLFLFVGLLFQATPAQADGARKIKIDVSDYTCAEVTQLLKKHRSIWIQSWLGLYDNLAASRQEIDRCSGSYRWPYRCNYWTPSLRTKDGVKCNVGVRCACFNEHENDD